MDKDLNMKEYIVILYGSMVVCIVLSVYIMNATQMDIGSSVLMELSIKGFSYLG